jgi:hypothetical protein
VKERVALQITLSYHKTNKCVCVCVTNPFIQGFFFFFFQFCDVASHNGNYPQDERAKFGLWVKEDNRHFLESCYVLVTPMN